MVRGTQILIAVGLAFASTSALAQSDAARRLDQKLGTFDPCAEKLKGLSAPGFKLECDTTVSGGTTLGSARVYYTVGRIEDCANYCRQTSRCVAFAFETRGREHSCLLYGPTPRKDRADGWVAGTR